jgi:hypothetical protein
MTQSADKHMNIHIKRDKERLKIASHGSGQDSLQNDFCHKLHTHTHTHTPFGFQSFLDSGLVGEGQWASAELLPKMRPNSRLSSDLQAIS